MEKLAKELLKTVTGAHMLDSGGAYGRHWESNQKVDFDQQPVAWADLEVGYVICPTASLYHWLVSRFEVDDLCDEFNALPVDDWDSREAYGLSADGEKWLTSHGFEIGKAFNSYNYDGDLSQVIQGSPLHHEELKDYYLLQVHQGCDVRGGYTDAVMVRAYDPDYLMTSGNVMALVTKANGEEIQCDDMYNGYSLTDQDGNDIIYEEGMKVEFWLLEF